jgi:putative tryptophan/tyrosine transport system substrate-binding protein
MIWLMWRARTSQLSTDGQRENTIGIISLNRPGGNITGSTFFNPELCAKRLELIKEAVPPTIRVGVLLNPDNPIHLPCLQEMERTAKSIKLELEPFQVRSPNEFESAFVAWDTRQVNAMTVIEDAMLIANSKAIVELVTKRRLPSIGFKEIAEGGGLMAYGVDFAKPFYRAAYFVDKINLLHLLTAAIGTHRRFDDVRS